MAHAQREPDRASLDARYGKSTGRRLDRILLISSAVILCAGFVAWLVLFGPFAIKGGLDSRDLGSRLVSEQTVEVKFQLSVDPGLSAACALQIQNASHEIVGWKIVHIPKSETRTRKFSENVISIQKPVTGLIYSCWLT